MKHLYIISFFTLLTSCKNEDKKTETAKEGTNLEIINSTKESNEKITSTEKKSKKKNYDTIPINYSENIKILEILQIIPRESMGSWEWTREDRIKSVDFISKNNFLIDSTKMYNDIKYLKPNTMGIQVVDGFWTLSIYKLDNNRYIVITNDVVGGGNDIKAFLLNNNELEKLKFENLFNNGLDNLLLDKSKTCLLELEDNFLTFDYDFSDVKVVKISSWAIKQNESKKCFKGNAIEFKLNQSKQVFELKKIWWK